MSENGIGRVYKRRGSRFWQIDLYVRGRRHTESSKSVRKADAQELLKKRIEQFRIMPGLMARATVGELLDDYLRDLDFRGSRALKTFERHANVARRAIGSELAATLDPIRLHDLQAEMRKKYAPSTVNFVLGFIRSSFRHAARQGKVERRLEIPRALPTNNARKGFLEHRAYLAILEELPEWAKDVFRFAYYSGWRRNEVLTLTWAEVDFENEVVHLDPARSKNHEGRTIPFVGEIGAVMARRQVARILGVKWVFHHHGGRRWSASSLNYAFRDARTIAGFPGVILHDCRRTAYRNLLRAGVLEKVAREMVGWRSRVMPDRYHVVDLQDMRTGAEKLRLFMEQKAREVEARVLPFAESERKNLTGEGSSRVRS